MSLDGVDKSPHYEDGASSHYLAMEDLPSSPSSNTFDSYAAQGVAAQPLVSRSMPDEKLRNFFFLGSFVLTLPVLIFAVILPLAAGLSALALPVALTIVFSIGGAVFAVAGLVMWNKMREHDLDMLTEAPQYNIISSGYPEDDFGRSYKRVYDRANSNIST